jgi:orotidine-5'-phosphate decarboxylase
MTQEQLISEIRRKRSFLCIGLDVDLQKIPSHLLELEHPIFEFNKAIIEATHHLAVAYKPNTAFYEAYGLKGWESLSMTIEYLNKNHPEVFTIADAKRGDIGNTSSRYAMAFFEDMNFDAITVAPYMGRDSVEPFLNFKGKHTILLALTSNAGATDFQTNIVDGNELYKSVIKTSLTWNHAENLMYVVGATKAEYLSKIREIIPNNFLLIPGVGAQGGSLKEVCEYGLNKNIGILINSSRGIIYASPNNDYAEAARKAAAKLQSEMSSILEGV